MFMCPRAGKTSEDIIFLLLISEERNCSLKWALFSTQFLVLFPTEIKEMAQRQVPPETPTRCCLS